MYFFRKGKGKGKGKLRPIPVHAMKAYAEVEL